MPHTADQAVHAHLRALIASKIEELEQDLAVLRRALEIFPVVEVQAEAIAPVEEEVEWEPPRMTPEAQETLHESLGHFLDAESREEWLMTHFGCGPNEGIPKFFRDWGGIEHMLATAYPVGFPEEYVKKLRTDVNESPTPHDLAASFKTILSHFGLWWEGL